MLYRKWVHYPRNKKPGQAEVKNETVDRNYQNFYRETQRTLVVTAQRRFFPFGIAKQQNNDSGNRNAH